MPSQKIDSPCELITNQQAAELLKVSVRTLDGYRSSKILKENIHWFKLGNSLIRFYKIPFEHWIMKNCSDR